MNRKFKFTKFTLLSTVILSAALFLVGCDRTGGAKTVNKLSIMQGDNQCAAPSSECRKQLVVELLHTRKGAITGKVAKYPVANVPVKFEPLPGSDVKIICDKPVSDHGGMVKARIMTGKVVGDQYFKVTPQGFPEVSKKIRVISGVEIKGGNQEGKAGHQLGEPITVKVYGKDGKPAGGVDVYFSLATAPGKKTKASLKPAAAVTDEHGIAKTFFKVGHKTGTYKIIAEISSPQKGIHARGILIKEYGLDIWGLGGIIVTVFGGLAIFIYGMKMMTDGLQLVAGDKMKKILNFFTTNRFAAVIAGTLVTGVIQSSSACTVMVVGFVNAGLLNLTQAIGVVFGANIGTTVTAQLISFKLEKVAFPAITIGLLMLFLSKRASWKGWASTLMGFGLLFFGLGIMSHELKLIKDFPSIIAFFRQFDCSPVVAGGHMPFGAVIGAIAIGTLMTVVIQSSSATIGIAIALASSGLLNFYTAVPLILGDNIGTTITANLAALGANRRSKQTAFAHFLFNALGATYMIVLFYVNIHGYPAFLYLINYITPGNAFMGENIARHIAMAHSVFNVFNVILFLPFISQIAKLCNVVIPIKDGQGEKLQYLEPHLLETPSVAIEQTVLSIRYMVKEAWNMIDTAMREHFLPINTDIEKFQELAKREDRMDDLQAEITSYLVKLTQRELNENQSQLVPLLMHCTNDAERIADHTENILALTERLKKTDSKISESAYQELENMWHLLSDQAQNVIDALNGTRRDKITFALSDEKRINKLADELEHSHIKRLSKGSCDPVIGIIFIEMLSELEKIGDHLSNIAERAPEIQKHYIEFKPQK